MPRVVTGRATVLPLLPRRSAFRDRFGHYFGKVVAKVEGEPTREMTTAHLRLRRRAAGVTLALALLAVTAVVAVLAVRSQPSMAAQFRPAPSASPSLVALLDCFGSSGSGDPVVAGSPGRTLLPDGWVWQDEADFRIGVPDAWRRTAADPQVFYRDAAGRRRLKVQAGA
jgi:hypothetical protein